MGWHKQVGRLDNLTQQAQLRLIMSDPLEHARAVHRSGDLPHAATLYTEILKQDPSQARAEAGLGVIALQTGRLDDAKSRLGRAAMLAPEDPLIQNNLGNAYMSAGQIMEAEAAFDKAATADPGFLDARYNRAVARHNLRRRPEAEADYRFVLDQAPERIDAAVNLAALLREAENPVAAIDVLEKGLAISGPVPDALLALAALYETVGRSEEALATLEQLPIDRVKDPQAVLTATRLDLRAGEPDQGLERLATLPVDAPDQAKRQAHYIKGLLLDRKGDIAGAYDALVAGNEAMRASRPDTDRLAKRYRSRMAVYRRDLTSREGGKEPVTPLPFNLVFFCGFPRSGTTLMEQILDAHPATITTGEDSPLHRLYETLPRPERDRNDPAEIFKTLSDGDRAALRERFVKIVDGQLGKCAGRTVIDKLPLNLVELGIIGRLFPDAKVLVAIRDPRDCVLSAFMQPFRINDAMACLLTLEDSAKTYADVFQLYRDTAPNTGLPIHEYRYEDLIDDFDGTIRRVIAFLGLDWDDGVSGYRERLAGRYIATPSYMAVTQGLNRRAIGRWRRYQAQMEAILPVLEPWIRDLGYESA